METVHGRDNGATITSMKARVSKAILWTVIFAVLAVSGTALAIKIIRLDPSRGHVGWEGILTINGTGLGEAGAPGQSFVAIEGLNVLVKSWTSTKIEVQITKTTTATPGNKRLVVHDKNAKYTETVWKVDK